MYLFLIIVTSLCFIIVLLCAVWQLLVYDMLVNVDGIYFIHVCEQARWARSAGNNAIENLCIIIVIIINSVRSEWNIDTRKVSQRRYLVLPLVCSIIVQELCESRGGRLGLSVLTSLMVAVDVKQYWIMLTRWSQLVPNMSTDIRGH